MGKPLDIAIIVVYLAAMLAFGFWGKSRTKDSADFLVAGRRLGPALYTGTMAAVVLGGASTVGGVAPFPAPAGTGQPSRNMALRHCACHAVKE